jgi:hypothetical protein
MDGLFLFGGSGDGMESMRPNSLFKGIAHPFVQAFSSLHCGGSYSVLWSDESTLTKNLPENGLLGSLLAFTQVSR